MRRKKKRTAVHYVTFGFRDGAATACLPERKPSAKHLKESGERADPDFVFREHLYGPSDLRGWELPQRVRTCDILANRLNVRRAIRELVLPELQAIRSLLVELNERVGRIESAN